MRSTDYGRLENDAVSICQKLIQIPSVNFGEGNGNEKEIAIFVSDFLTSCGIANQIIESAPNRANVIARIKGSDSSRPGLVLHGHLDTVPATVADWNAGKDFQIVNGPYCSIRDLKLMRDDGFTDVTLLRHNATVVVIINIDEAIRGTK